MAVTFGGSAVLKVTDTGATLRDLSTYIKSTDGLPGSAALEDVTTLGAAGQARIYAKALNDAKFTLNLMWDPTATSGPDAVLGPLLTDATARGYQFGPQGTTTGNIRYTGNAFLEEYKITAAADKYVTAVATFQRSGAGTRDTWP